MTILLSLYKNSTHILGITLCGVLFAYLSVQVGLICLPHGAYVRMHKVAGTSFHVPTVSISMPTFRPPATPCHPRQPNANPVAATLLICHFIGRASASMPHMIQSNKDRRMDMVVRPQRSRKGTTRQSSRPHEAPESFFRHICTLIIAQRIKLLGRPPERPTSFRPLAHAPREPLPSFSLSFASRRYEAIRLCDPPPLPSRG